MKYTEFYTPTGKIIKNIDIQTMYKYTVEGFEKYWSDGQGAEIHYFEDNFSATLTIGVNLNYGFYFNYSDRKIEEISLFDINKIEDITETTDELEVSVGLFIPPILAWEVIKTFIEEGKASKQIQWINPDNLPEDSRFY
ncbi:MAG: hypothetical protein PUA51_08300 [Oscillospiraceae bacterium]|jgi:hypothetical protein|nr:hypothetical protein [Oscillospiraceae bacterium]